MRKRDNPYTPGAGRKPPTLAGRDEDLENFQSLIERLVAGGYERSLIYSGLRGVGKTLTRNFFGRRFQLTTDAQQRHPAAMASLGNPPYPSADIARSYGAKDQRGVSIHRDALIQKGILWAPRRGRLD